MPEWYGNHGDRLAVEPPMRRTAILILAMALAGATAACSASSSKKASVASPSAAAGAQSGYQAQAGDNGKTRVDLTQAKRRNREVIHTAEVGVQTKDVDAALDDGG